MKVNSQSEGGSTGAVLPAPPQHLLLHLLLSWGGREGASEQGSVGQKRCDPEGSKSSCGEIKGGADSPVLVPVMWARTWKDLDCMLVLQLWFCSGFCTAR